LQDAQERQQPKRIDQLQHCSAKRSSIGAARLSKYECSRDWNCATVDELFALHFHIQEESAMNVREAMTRDVRLAYPEQTIRQAAQVMAELDVGSLPVEDGDRLIGIITDRDIAIRAVAQGMGADTLVREVMSKDIRYCYEDQTVEEVAQNMGDLQVRRLPVVNREKRLVGILSLGDLARERSGRDGAGQALGEISRPGGAHSQSNAHH
jgi:CBS domain-containing protein